MGLFRKKQRILGGAIEPNCRYCRYNSADEHDPDDQVKCPNYTEGAECCRRYEYDPTKRVPKNTPRLGNYTQDDFSL